MVREIVIWCSNHLMTHDERVAAKPIQVSFEGKQSRLLDLCEDCMKEFVAPLRELVEQFGDKTQMPTPKSSAVVAPAAPRHVPSQTERLRAAGQDERVDCLVCGKSLARAGESSHYGSAHGTSKGRWLINHGQGEGVVECPVSGCDFAAMHEGGLAVHLTRSSDASHRAYRASHPSSRSK